MDYGQWMDNSSREKRDEYRIIDSDYPLRIHTYAFCAPGNFLRQNEGIWNLTVIQHKKEEGRRSSDDRSIIHPLPLSMMGITFHQLK
jgi:hypothetical protein